APGRSRSSDVNQPCPSCNVHPLVTGSQVPMPWAHRFLLPLISVPSAVGPFMSMSSPLIDLSRDYISNARSQPHVLSGLPICRPRYFQVLEAQ
ncbi:unnamed protein product, partial [Mycena citricolor]